MVSITYCKQKASTAILFCCECLCHLLCCLTLDSIATDMPATLHELCIVKLTKSIPDGIHILDYSMLYSCYIYSSFLCSFMTSINPLSVYRIINKQHNMWQFNGSMLPDFHSRWYTRDYSPLSSSDESLLFRVEIIVIQINKSNYAKTHP